MDLLLWIVVPNLIYLVVALGLRWWVRHETCLLVDQQMRSMRRLSTAVLFAPGLFISGHSILPGFALAALMFELYLGEGRLSWPTWQLSMTLGPMIVLYVVLLIRERAFPAASSLPE